MELSASCGRLFFVLATLFLLFFVPASGQVIQFESGGLQYQSLSHEGLTIMFAELPTRIRDYAVLQVAVSNGSPSARTVKPEDFRLLGDDGLDMAAAPAGRVVEEFLAKAGRGDVIKLVVAYESGLYGLSRFKSTSGYEQRRQAAVAELTSSRLKAAATASAIAFVATKLKPGESTDGAVFFRLQNRPLGPGKLVATLGVERFEFEIGGLKHAGELIRRP
jgi:hypothetical protein